MILIGMVLVQNKFQGSGYIPETTFERFLEAMMGLSVSCSTQVLLRTFYLSSLDISMHLFHLFS